MTATGLNSPSGALTVTGLVAGALSAVEGVLTPGSTAHTAVYGGGGILLGLGAVVSKLFHDKGIHVATIEQAGSDIATQLPQLRLDASTTVGFIENDVPTLKATITELTGRVAAAEAHVASVVAPDATVIESVVRKVLGQLTAPPPAPEALPAT